MSVMKKASLFKIMNFWPPFLGAGIRVKRINNDMTEVDVEMNLSFWNRNYVKTHFGGSLYAMTDPFLMLMLLENLGKDYIVWDKSASINFKKPGRGKVKVFFRLPQERILEIKELADNNQKIEPEFTLEVLDDEGNVIAEVFKKLYVKNKRMKK